MPLTEVRIAPASTERFRELLGGGYEGVEDAIRTAARVLPGRVVWHINSTARGGGVAEMLQSLLAYARGAGVDVRWAAVSGNPDFFRITKRLHNQLHGSAGDGGELGEAEREIYERALVPAAEELGRLVSPDDVVYIHDPQPAPLLEMLRDRGVASVWRCHVGVDHPNELARDAWDFLRPYVELADAYVFSRVEFVWEELDRDRVWIVPPSIDAFSAKNQELSPEVQHAIISRIGIADDGGEAPVFHRNDGTVARVNRVAETDQDERIPWDAPLIAQISRWDRLKDPVGLLDCFAEHVHHPEARLLLAGPSVAGVADDPEGAEVLAEVRIRRAELPEGIRRRTHLVSLPMNDVEENAAMVNALQRRADVVVQKSIQEGFGLTVAEAMWKARPVVAGRVGGIQDQIVDGAGILVDDPADLVAVGEAIDGLLGDPERAAEMGRRAKERVRQDYLGTRHLIQYMGLLEKLLAERG
ncbi:MAG TPA: glycosyltransferase [Solirubrobacterales bacterium]|nr:glycosyltransferase [Solirubrobacterales bacterium]